MNQREPRVLIAGESWIMHTVHQKGVDSFTTTAYGEGHRWLSDALEGDDFDVEHLPNHLASSSFPIGMDQLERYDAVVLSDIGSNTLLLHPETFERSVALPNRLDLIHDYVHAGGALVMIGGYLTFQGFEGKARYAGTAVESALPVQLMNVDDRIEAPSGVSPEKTSIQHPITDGLPAIWPDLLGYNRIVAKDSADVLAVVGDDPLLVSWALGQGRAVAFASDCGPHWIPPQFLGWEGYGKLWTQMMRWVVGR